MACWMSAKKGKNFGCLEPRMSTTNVVSYHKGWLQIANLKVSKVLKMRQLILINDSQMIQVVAQQQQMSSLPLKPYPKTRSEQITQRGLANYPVA